MTWDSATIAGLRAAQGLRGATEVVLIDGLPPFTLDLDGPLYDDNPLLAEALSIPQAPADGAPAPETRRARAERNQRILHWYDDLAAATIVHPRYYHRDQVARGQAPADGLTIRDLLAAPGALGRLIDAIYPPEVLAPLKTFRGESGGAAAAPAGEGLQPDPGAPAVPPGAVAGAAVAQRGRVGARAARRGAGAGGGSVAATPRAARGQ